MANMEIKKCPFFLDYYLTVILIGFQLWSDSVCQLIPGYNLHTGSSVTVQRGLCLHVPCSFTVPSNVQLSTSTTGIWFLFQNGKAYIAVSKNNLVHQTNGRFFLTGNVASGDCSYSIEDPLPADEGKYYFQFEDGARKFLFADITPYVDVTELTDRPTISSTRLVDGEEVTLTCTSPGRCQNIRPQITWEGPMTGVRQEMYYTPYEDGSKIFFSNITFTPRKSHNNSPLFCNVTLKPDLSTVEKRTLNVEYEEESSHRTHIILAAIGTICLLLLALLAFACWRKRQKKPTSAEPAATYANLRVSDITSTYNQLEPEIPAYTDVLGSGAALDYENVK